MLRAAVWLKNLRLVLSRPLMFTAPHVIHLLLPRRPPDLPLPPGEREGAHHLDRQDGRPPDVPLQRLAGRRSGHLQILRDERPSSQGRRRLRECPRPATGGWLCRVIARPFNNNC